jgi:hypothetical protein
VPVPILISHCPPFFLPPSLPTYLPPYPHTSSYYITVFQGKQSFTQHVTIFSFSSSLPPSFPPSLLPSPPPS